MLIKTFIVWYLRKHNAEFKHKDFVVRVFTKGYYDRVMRNHNIVEKRIYNPEKQIRIVGDTE